MWKTNENNHPPPTTGTKAQLLGDSRWPFSQPIRGHRHPLKGLRFHHPTRTAKNCEVSIASKHLVFFFTTFVSSCSLTCIPKKPSRWLGRMIQTDPKIQRVCRKPAVLKIVFEDHDLQLDKLYTYPQLHFTHFSVAESCRNGCPMLGRACATHLDFSHFHSPRIHQRLEKPC